MTSKHDTAKKQPRPETTIGAWALRHRGLILKDSNGDEVHEFLGILPFTNALSREAPC